MKPTLRLFADPKDPKKNRSHLIASGWPRRSGAAFVLDSKPYRDDVGVRFIELNDGTRITTGPCGEYYLNLAPVTE